MTALTETERPEIDELDFETFYADHFDFLVGVAVRKFGIPEIDAEALAQDVFVSYLKQARVIRDLHPWILGAICHASRYYWRQRGKRFEAVDPELALAHPDPTTARILDTLMDRMAAREALERLNPRYQEILRLRYFDGLSVGELAERLGVKTKYAQKLLTKCLRRAEHLYSEKGQKR